MSMAVRERWPLWVVLIGLYLTVIALLLAIIHQTEGIFLYALDDAYIHLAMAKHFANDGVWGVTRSAFSASTSSPGWTLLLSLLIGAFDRPDIWPLILNLLAATGVVLLVNRLIKPVMQRARWRFFTLVFIVLLAPLPVLIFTGMEHVLQLLLIALLFALLQRYESSYPRVQRVRWALWLVAALLTAVRYESLFLLLPLAGYYLLWRRDWRLAIGLVAASALGPLTMGVIQVANGWYFLPNSILAKGTNVTAGGLSTIMDRFLYNVPRSVVLLVLALIVLCLTLIRYRHGRRSEPLAGWTASFLIATIMQYTLAQVGWLYRYEAYLILFGCLLIFAGDYVTSLRAWFRSLKPRGRLAATVGFALVAWVAVPITGFRMWRALDDIVPAAHVVYTEYYQMARFIARYYPDSPVVLTDLGLISYFTSVKPVDLFALANRESLAAQLSGTFDTHFIDQWAQAEGAPIAMIHDLFYSDSIRLPSKWLRVGGWKVYNSFYGIDAILSIYAIPPAHANEVERQFAAFAPSLPPPIVSQPPSDRP